MNDIFQLARLVVDAYRRQAPILFDPRAEDPPAANAAFLATLPEDIRSEPSLKSIQDVNALAKSYVHGQKLIGTKRLPVPDANWNDQQWGEFYDQAGRPKTADEYKVPDIKLEDGLKLEDAKLKVVREHFHKLGLSGKQASGVLEYYMNSLNEGVKGSKSASEQANQAAIISLRGEWGEKFDANVDLAKVAIRKFGDENLANFLESSGLGNNAPLVKMLSKIGAMTLEDTSRGGGADFNIKDSTRAIAEIDNLKLDKDFQAALGTANHPGHKAAVDRWGKLHQVGYPGKVTE